MKLSVFKTSKNKTGEVNLPSQFDEPVRKDLIKRAVLALQSNKRQAYGSKPEAGKRASAILSKRRRAYRGMYGFGISRTPRKILSRRGRRMNWVGAFSPNTVGGRRAHPPKAEKILGRKTNKKENKKAIRSAITATVISDLVKERGHIAPQNYPFALDKNFEELSKTKEALAALKELGFEKELIRVNNRTIRAGKEKHEEESTRLKKDH